MISRWEEDRLEKVSQRTGRSMSLLVRAAVLEHLAVFEDPFAADESLDMFERAGRRSRPLAALKADTEL